MLNRSKITRIISLFLIAVLLYLNLPNFNLTAFANDGNRNFRSSANVNTYQRIAENTAKILRSPTVYAEKFDKEKNRLEVDKTANSRTYLTESGSYETEFYQSNLTYTGKNGKELDVDNTLVKKSPFLGFIGEKEHYENKANGYTLNLPVNGDGYKISNKGYTAAIKPLFGSLQNPVTAANALRYNDIVKGIDLQYTALSNSVKEDIILKTPAQLPEFSYELTAKGVSFYLEDNVVYGVAKDEIIFGITAPVMTDASGAESANIRLALDKNTLTVIPDQSWLTAPERAYPVKIDPTWNLHNGGTQNWILRTSNYPCDSTGYLYVGWMDGAATGSIGGNASRPWGQTRGWMRVEGIVGTYLDDMPDNAVVQATLNLQIKPISPTGATKPRIVDVKQVGGITPVESFMNGGGSGSAARNDPTCQNVNNWLTLPLTPATNNDGSVVASAEITASDDYTFDITSAVKNWVAAPSSNHGLMFTPRDEDQMPSCVMATGRLDANSNPVPDAVILTLEVSTPSADVDENLSLVTNDLQIYPLTQKNTGYGQTVAGVFGAGLMRPNTDVTYNMTDGTAYTAKSEFNKLYPDQRKFSGAFSQTLWNIFTHNWQSRLYAPGEFVFDTKLYNLTASGEFAGYTPVPDSGPLAGLVASNTSDNFVLYKFKEADALNWVAQYYGVSENQIIADNLVMDRLVFPGDTLFIRNPTRNAITPYTFDPNNADEAHLIDRSNAFNGRMQSDPLDLEPVNMDTGSFHTRAVDAESSEFEDVFRIARNYNSVSIKSAGAFGRGWTFEYAQTLQGAQNGNIKLYDGEGKRTQFNGNFAGSDNLTVTNGEQTLRKIKTGAGIEEVRYEVEDVLGNVRHFNEYGVLQKQVNARGQTTQITYTNGKISGITTVSGKQYDITTNDSGQIIGVTLPSGGQLAYHYDGNGFLTAFQNADGVNTYYTYNSASYLEEVRLGANDSAHMFIKNEYDNLGRVTKQTDGEGNVSRISYTSAETAVTYADGISKTYQVDSNLRSTGFSTAVSNAVSKTLTDGKPTAITEKTGLTSTYLYDGKGNITRETRADGSYRELTYNNKNKPLTVRDFDGTVTANTYYPNGLDLKQTTKPGGAIYYDEYYPNGRVKRLRDGLGTSTEFVYSPTSSGEKLTETTTANGQISVKEFYYNKLGQLITEVDENGVETRHMHTLGGRKLGVSVGVGANIIAEEYGFDSLGNVNQIKDANGYISAYEYDKLNRITKSTAPNGGFIAYGYDARGRKISETDANGAVNSWTYDADGNLLTDRNALGDTAENHYNAKGQLDWTKDRNGNETRFEYDDLLNLPTKITTADGDTLLEYDAMGRVTRRQNPDGTVTTDRYDSTGRVTSHTDERGVTTNFAYDDNGNVLSTSDSLGRSTAATYDFRGNILTSSDYLGRVTSYTYDNAGRKTSETRPGNLTTQYFYDHLGRVVRQINAGGFETKTEYDSLGNIRLTIDALGNRFETVYNSVGDKVAETAPNGGVTTYEYNAAQLLTAEVLPNGQRTEYKYDRNYNLAQIKDPRGNITKFEYDKNGNQTKITAADGSVTQNFYDSENRNIKTVAQNGLTAETAYDSMGRVLRTWDNAGGFTEYTYDSFGRPIAKKDAPGRVATTEYDAFGRVSKTVDADGNVTETTYDLLGRTLTTKGNDGRITASEYDAAGNLSAKIDADGRRTGYTYDKLGHTLTETDPAGRVTAYEYDANGQQIKVTNPDNTTRKTVYNAVGAAVETVDERGNSSFTEYDLSGRAVKTIDAEGAVTETAYDACGNAVKTRDALGFVTETVYDNMNRAVDVVTPRGGHSRSFYNAKGELYKTQNVLGFETLYTYDLRGNALTTTHPSGLVETTEYDLLDRAIRTSDSAGAWKETVYNAKGDIDRESDQSGAETSYTHDIMHRVLTTTDALGGVTSNVYDPRGNATQTVSKTGAVIEKTYDILDRVVTEKASLTAQFSTVYDIMGRVTETRQGDKISKTEYDKGGNAVKAIDPLGNSTQTEYDKMSRAVKVTDPLGGVYLTEVDPCGRVVKTVDPLGNSTATAYDADGNKIFETDADGKTTAYYYDLAGQLTKMIDPLKRNVNYAYDNAGNQISRTVGAESGSGATLGEAAGYVGKTLTTKFNYDLRGNQTAAVTPTGRTETKTYDPSSRLIKNTLPSGKATEHSYDALGHQLTKGAVSYVYNSAGLREKMTDQTGETAYEYDVLGRLTTVVNALGERVEYAYDEFGRESAITYPNGETAEYSYDLADRMIRVEKDGETTNYTYNANGNVLTCERDNGIVTAYEYDALNRLIKLTNELSTLNSQLSTFFYTYSPTGKILTETAVNDGKTVNKTYETDAAGALKTYTADGVKTTYTYNQFGDRLAVSGGKTVKYSYNDDGQVTAKTGGDDGKITYEYDADGNLTVKTAERPSAAIGLFSPKVSAEYTYTYDGENRLKSVREDSALLMVADYDGDGNRTFQLSRTLVPAAVEKPEQGENPEGVTAGDKGDTPNIADPYLQNEDTAQPDDRSQIPQTGDNKSAGDSATGTSTTPGTYSYYEKVYEEPNWFWYGFGQGILRLWSGINQALAVTLSWDFSDAWEDYWENQYTLEIRSSVEDEYSAEDLDALRQAGLNENDIYDITHPQTNPIGTGGNQQPNSKTEVNNYIAVSNEKQKPESGAENALPDVNGNGGSPIMIPAFPDEQTRIDYDLTYYVNDVNLTNTQVLAEYGRRGELKNVYTYGVQRLNAARVDGTVDTYEYDGRGSVVSDGVHTYEYDPFGGILSEISGELPFFGYNAEEYNPVTGLVYLRARYYNVETGTFISEDSYLGSDDNISSQNRYAFGEGDPINNIDPTGHFASLITQQAGWQTDYWGNKFDKYANSQITNQTNAINERSYNDYSISEKKANEYAKNGGDAARGLCTSYSCVPGSQVEKAISAMEDHIDDVEKTSNEKIKEIRDNNMALWAPSAPKPSTPSDGGSSGGSSSSSTGGNAGGGGNGGSSNSENSVPERTQYENDLISELSGKIKLTHTFNNITIKLNLGITVYLGLHKVIPPFPFYHATLFIFVTPSARVYYNDYSRGKLSFKDLYDTNGVKIQGVKYATIGGTSSQEGPDNGNPLTGLLIGGYNRPSDMKLESKISVEKLNITDLERLFNLVDTFNNKSNLGYSLFAIGKQYNSSSFMRGLLNVYGIDLGDKTGNRYVGWNKPAPSNYYF